MMRLRLKRRGSELVPELRVFDRDVVLVGREIAAEDPTREAVWLLPYEDVSRRQCRFEGTGGVVCVENLSQRSHVFVNREQIKGIRRLAVGDQVRFGLCEIVLLGEVAEEEKVVMGDIPERREATPVAKVPRPPVTRGPVVETSPVPVPAAPPAPAPSSDVLEDMMPIVERAQRWEELGRPARELLGEPRLLERGRRGVLGGAVLGGAAALVRTYVEASAHAERVRRQQRGAAGVAVMGSVFAGVLTAHALAWPINVEAPVREMAGRPVCRELARLEDEVARVQDETDPEVGLLRAAAVVQEAAELNCLGQSSAERRLRERLAGQRSVRLGEHTGRKVVAAAMDEVGRRAATVDDSGRVQVWDLERGTAKELRDVHQAKALAWSADGKWLVVGGAAKERGGEVVIYDAGQSPTQESLQKRFRGEHRDWVTRIFFNGRASDRFITGDRRGEIRLWAPRLDEPLLDRAQLGDDELKEAAFDAGRERIYTLAGERVTMWTATNEMNGFGKARVLVERGVRAMAVSAAGLGKSVEAERVLTGDRYGTVTLWEVAPRVRGRLAHQRPTGAIAGLTFVPGKPEALVTTEDGRLLHLSLAHAQGKDEHFAAREFERLGGAPTMLAAEVERGVTLSDKGLLEVWDLKDFERRPIARIEGAAVSSLDLARGRILTGDVEGQVRVWYDLNAGSGGAYDLILKRGRPRELAIRGHLLASLNTEGRVEVWNTTPVGRPLELGELPGSQQVKRIAISGDSKWVAGVGEGEVVVWEVEGERRVTSVPHVNVRHAAWNDSGDVLMTVGNDVREWRVEGGQLSREARVIWDLQGAQAERLAVAKDQAVLSLRHGATENKLYLVPLGGNGGVLTAPLVTESSLATVLIFDTHGRRLAAGYEDGATRTWTIERGGGVEGRVYNSGAAVTALSFAPEGPLAVGDRKGAIHLIDLVDVKATPVGVDGHSRAIVGVGFGDSEEAVLSAAQEPAVLLSRQRQGEPIRLDAGEEVIAFAAEPTGRFVVTASGDSLRVWPVEAADLVALTCSTVGADRAGEWRPAAGKKSPCQAW